MLTGTVGQFGSAIVNRHGIVVAPLASPAVPRRHLYASAIFFLAALHEIYRYLQSTGSCMPTSVVYRVRLVHCSRAFSATYRYLPKLVLLLTVTVAHFHISHRFQCPVEGAVNVDHVLADVPKSLKTPVDHVRTQTCTVGSWFKDLPFLIKQTNKHINGHG